MNLVEALKCDACGCECGQGKAARGEWRLGIGMSGWVGVIFYEGRDLPVWAAWAMRPEHEVTKA